MKAWAPSEYCLEITAPPDDLGAEKIFDRVWRSDFTAPGFCLLDAGTGLDSHTLRRWMVELKKRLSAIAKRRGRSSFLFRSLARFDQQETTKFHIDGAPPESMLLLGYEPSRVHSRLFLADFTQAAFDRGITPQQFLHDFNPMYRHGEELLVPYVTELPPPAEGHWRILLINNSFLPYTASRPNPLGVMHQAIIVAPNEAERRVVNSSMLATEGTEVGAEQRDEFMATDAISQKGY